jgi:hypothetical protein
MDNGGADHPAIMPTVVGQSRNGVLNGYQGGKPPFRLAFAAGSLTPLLCR